MSCESALRLTLSVHSPDARVHAHAYLHLKTAYRRRGAQALQPFTFEGIRPHVVTNTAQGNAYSGAVRYGHFYVVMDKIGSLCLGQLLSRLFF